MADITKRLVKSGLGPIGEEAAFAIADLRLENMRLRAATLNEAAKVAEGFPKNREWVKDSLYDTLRREVAADIRKLI